MPFPYLLQLNVPAIKKLDAYPVFLYQLRRQQKKINGIRAQFKTFRYSRKLTPGGTLLTGTGFVDNGLASADFSTIESINGGLCLNSIGHFNKTKTFGTTGFPVGYHAGGTDFAILFKDAAQFIPVDAVRQIAYINIHPFLPKIWICCTPIDYCFRNL